MTAVLWAGTLVGVVFGLFHALYVYRLVMAEGPADAAPSHARAGYYALWTLGLWLFFGTYMLVLWLIGAAFWLIFKAGR